MSADVPVRETRVVSVGVEPERAAFVDVNRTSLRVWEWGDEDAPAVIFVHGAYDHGRMWDGFAPRIAAFGYRAVAIDIRGHGDSGRLSSGQMWSVSALDIALLARHLGPPVGIIGHSFGAGQAMYAAGVWPELFRWVVNLDGLGPGGDDGDGEWDIVEAATRSLEGAERILTTPPRRYASPAEMEARRQGVNVRLPAEWVAHLVTHGTRETPDGWEWKADPMFRTGFPGDFDNEYMAAELGLVQAPVLVLTGAEDDTWSDMSQDAIDRRLALIRDVRHHTVPRAGHYVHVEQPDLVAREVAAFLAEVDT